MKTRHLLAVLAITGGLLFLSACGDDNDTRPPQPTPTNTQPPLPTSTQPPATATTGPGLTATPTSTPEVSPSPTGARTPEFNFVCDVETAYVCAGGSRDGQACRPVCHLQPPGESCDTPEINFCQGANCTAVSYFCKSGPNDGDPCTPPGPGDPNPCGEGGRCGNSELAICTQPACPTSLRPVSGNTQLEVTCAADECRGKLLVRDPEDPFSGFDPVLISGIGNICVRAVDPSQLACPAGKIDCNGGEPLDYDLLQQHTIGSGTCRGGPKNGSPCQMSADCNGFPCPTCTGNEQCIQMCQEYCQAMDPPRAVADSGCAGFCEGGGRDGLTCGCDRKNIQCKLDDCPDGSCVGKDNPEPANRDICGCQCLETGGNPSSAGGFNFQIPAQIIVESDSDPLCGVGPVLITLPPQCIPFTTERMSGLLTRANNTPEGQIPPADCMQEGKQIPGCIGGKLVRDGRRVDCETLQTGNIAQMDLVGNISFFDSAIGDIEVVLDWFCK